MNKSIPRLALAGLFALTAGVASAASVNVSFHQSENFSDMPWTAWEREQVLKDLTAHFSKLGARLPKDAVLKVDVLDIDLAGRRHYSFRWATDLRILQGGADWPHMRIRYSLERDGKVIASGEELLKDMMYLDRASRYSSSDALRFEKQMLDDWFKEKLAPVAVAAR